LLCQQASVPDRGLGQAIVRDHEGAGWRFERSINERRLRDCAKFRRVRHGPSGTKPLVAGAGEQFSRLQRWIKLGEAHHFVGRNAT
jgi:hypothetical protein